MLKLIVFDCDGVMFDSQKANCMFYNHLLKHFGLAAMDEEEQHFVHIHNVITSVKHIFRHHSQPTLEEVHDYRLSCDYAPYLQYMTMEPDLIAFLQATGKNHHLAISTNRTNTMVPLLKSFKIEKYFEKVVTASTAKRPKPAPDGMLEILEHFGCLPEEAVFIGDSIIDEQHAASCNVPLIAFRNPDLKAHYHVNSFLEILSLPIF
jgi:phosphoglycolate phosphatase